MRESEIQKKILDYLKSIGVYSVKVIQASKAGVPDIIGCKSITITQEMVGKQIGAFIAIEVKTPKTKYNTSELQKLNLDWIKEASGVAIVAWELEQIKSLL